ncbi:MAG: DUF481 domain-containing protein [Acidobacteriaceae bacterium]|nr:DUF481 domain-containing protein [Acidobacteriaceae bacterium]
MITYGAQAQTPGSDVIVCKTGEKFVGHVVSSNDSSVVFKSDAAGQVTVDWSKIQELHSPEKFAVIQKGVKLHGAEDENKAPQGTIAVTDQQVQVTGGAQAAAQTIPVTNVAQVIDEASFRRAFERRNFFQAWNGGATAGIAYTNSTQKSQSYTAAVNLTRAVPGETWLDQRSRTVVSFNEAYGKISQPATPVTKTSIVHLGVEQDWYLKPRLFVFVQGLFDHNYSQGLNLQQDYGGGLGFVVLKNDRHEFDIKASLDYINQRFTIASQNKSLIGSTFGEAYVYKFAHGVVFTESGNYIPAWNNTTAYSALANANLTFPVYHRVGFTVGGIDNYLNDPPLGFKKNSFTLTFGASYGIQ